MRLAGGPGRLRAEPPIRFVAHQVVDGGDGRRRARVRSRQREVRVGLPAVAAHHLQVSIGGRGAAAATAVSSVAASRIAASRHRLTHLTGRTPRRRRRPAVRVVGAAGAAGGVRRGRVFDRPRLRPAALLPGAAFDRRLLFVGGLWFAVAGRHRVATGEATGSGSAGLTAGGAPVVRRPGGPVPGRAVPGTMPAPTQAAAPPAVPAQIASSLASPARPAPRAPPVAAAWATADSAATRPDPGSRECRPPRASWSAVEQRAGGERRAGARAPAARGAAR